MPFKLKSILTNVFRYYNRKRRRALRKKRLLQNDVKFKNNHSIPKLPSCVMLISTSKGWGDSLYVAGFAKRLKKWGVYNVLIAAPSCIIEHFDNPIFDGIYELDDICLSNIRSRKIDLIVDLTYINLSYYKERLMLIQQLQCAAITVCEESKYINTYSHFVNYSLRSHISNRMALILEQITQEKQAPIYPLVFFDEHDSKTISRLIIEKFSHSIGSIAYLNTVARDSDRCFSIEQICALSKVLLNYFSIVIVNAESDIIIDDCEERVFLLPSITFKELCALISKVSFVVTPDTAVTHIASCLDVPSFVVFPPNDRDYWKQYPAKECWGSLSSKSLTYSIDDADLIIDRWGYANHSSRACSSYNPSSLAYDLNRFIRTLK